MAKTPADASTTEKTSRPRKTPQERAQLQLDRAQKRYNTAKDRRDKFNADVTALDTELAESERFLEFAKGSRHLPQNAEQAGGEAGNKGDSAVETYDPAS